MAKRHLSDIGRQRERNESLPRIERVERTKECLFGGQDRWPHDYVCMRGGQALSYAGEVRGIRVIQDDLDCLEAYAVGDRWPIRGECSKIRVVWQSHSKR